MRRFHRVIPLCLNNSVARLFAVLTLFLFAAACAPAPSPTPTQAAPSVTPNLFARPTQPTRDPLIGPPTLPPEYTLTPTPTLTLTPTVTATPTQAPTPQVDAICDKLSFPAEVIDGLTFAASGGSSFVVQVAVANASMTWLLTNLDDETSEVLTFNPGEGVLVNPSTLVRPGRFRWTLFVTTPDYARICEQMVTFTVLPPLSPTAPGLFDLLFGLAPTMTPTTAPTPDS